MNRTTMAVTVALLVPALAAGGSCVGVQAEPGDDGAGGWSAGGEGGGHAPGAPPAPAGGSAGAGGEGGAPPLTCDDLCAEFWPTGDAIDCTGVGPAPGGSCFTFTLPDGEGCWRGVGTCVSGACVAPAASCDQAPPRGSSPLCSTDADCDDGNPCTWDDCPEPGCAPCHHGWVDEGTICGPGKACLEGACCVAPAP